MKDKNEGNMNKNRYATKKTIAQGLLDLALLISNISQLKAVLDEGDSYPNYYAVISLISVSIGLQVIVGLLMIILGFLDLENTNKEKVVRIMNDVVTMLILLITVVNIAINTYTLNHEIKIHTQ